MTKLVASFPLDGRNKRDLKLFKNTPKEFFYGTNNLSEKYKVDYIDSRTKPDTFYLKVIVFFEFILSRLRLSIFNRSRVLANEIDYSKYKLIISFTDLYSINLGLFYPKKRSQLIIGVFHGLSDIIDRQPIYLRYYAKKKILKSLSKIDHLVFLGERDMIEAKKNFKFELCKSSILTFGVDSDFWKCKKDIIEDIDVLCVGSDINRDYEILKKLSSSINITLITSKKIDVSHFININYINGNLYNSKVSDSDLRNFYQRSKIILVPIHNVFQPSGQSVTLQAMACEKPVIISKTKGIFETKRLKNNFNIKFTPPNNAVILEKNILELLQSKKLRNSIGFQARKTIKDHFTLSHMSLSLENILDKTLSVEVKNKKLINKIYKK